MSIFRRGKKAGSGEGGAGTSAAGPAPEATSEEAQSGPAGDDASAAPRDAGTEETGASGSPDAGNRGPYDVSEVGDSAGRLDLGGLRVVGLPGMELRLEVEEASQNVVAVTAVLGDSAVQLQAFAAPRTTGIWDAIRAEIAESIVAQGGTADEQRGVLGPELRTRMPSAGPDGRTVYAPARFVGVDGPRWFLRAVFSGRAAIDDAAAAPLVDMVRGTVVVRGDAAMAPRELLPLRLPEEVAPADTGQGADDAGQRPGGRVEDLNPFERGPEITEVR